MGKWNFFGGFWAIPASAQVLLLLCAEKLLLAGLEDSMGCQGLNPGRLHCKANGLPTVPSLLIFFKKNLQAGRIEVSHENSVWAKEHGFIPHKVFTLPTSKALASHFDACIQSSTKR